METLLQKRLRAQKGLCFATRVPGLLWKICTIIDRQLAVGEVSVVSYATICTELWEGTALLQDHQNAIPWPYLDIKLIIYASLAWCHTTGLLQQAVLIMVLSQFVLVNHGLRYIIPSTP
jgi:hypothetical protein